MSTLYHTSYSSLVLNAPAGPEKTLSVLVLFVPLYSIIYLNTNIFIRFHFVTHSSREVKKLVVFMKPNSSISQSTNNEYEISFQMSQCYVIDLHGNLQVVYSVLSHLIIGVKCVTSPIRTISLFCNCVIQLFSLVYIIYAFGNLMIRKYILAEIC